MNIEIQLLTEKINASINHGASITILKGFSREAIDFLQERYTFIENPDLFDTEGFLQLAALEDNLFSLLNRLQEVEKNNQSAIMLYETFFALQENIKNITRLKIQFILLENNLLEYYPCITREKGVDINLLPENQLNVELGEEEKIFSVFYSNYQENEGKQWVQYIPLPDDIATSIQHLPLISIPAPQERETFLERIQKVEEFPAHAIAVSLQQMSWEAHKKYILEQSAYPSAEYCLLDTLEDRDAQSKKEALDIFAEFLATIGCQASFYQKDSRIPKHSIRAELLNLLRKHWGAESRFRDIEFYKDPTLGAELITINQGDIIENIIKQYENYQTQGTLGEETLASDIFLTAPTGAGKSLLFQLPAIYLANVYQVVTIVVSPLIALMKDQVINLRNRNGYPNAVCLNSEISFLQREAEIEKIKNGEYHIVYLSPELLLAYDITYFIGERELGLLVIDEAHLVTTWGRDFRVDYWYLGNYIRKLRNYHIRCNNFVLLALTATAIYNPGGKTDMVFETIDSLCMKSPIIYLGKIRRDNIDFEISNVDLKSHKEEKLELTGKRINSFIEQNKKTIVYCPWISQMKEVLNHVEPNYRNQIATYHGTLDKSEKEKVYFKFRDNQLKVMLATKAFGMGVDIQDVEVVYHHAPSSSLADYVQEIGRLARIPAIQGKAILDFHESDLNYTKILYGLSSIKQYQVKQVLEKLNKIYKQRKSRNLMVTVEDFQHIFINVIDVDDLSQKVKSALMLLEKDLFQKYKFFVMLARPKSLFTTAFLRIEEKLKSKMEQKYGEYLKPIPPEVFSKIGQCYYTIDLLRLWENYFQEKSFPLFKKEFFDGSLLGTDFPYTPQLRVNISLLTSPQLALNLLTYVMESIEQALSYLDNGKYFTKEELTKALKKEFFNRSANFLEKLTDLIIYIYSAPTYGNQLNQRVLPADCFLISKRDYKNRSISADTVTYKVVSSAYAKVTKKLQQTFINTFGHSAQKTAPIVNKTVFISNQKENGCKAAAERIKTIAKLAFILETFDAANFEMLGGEFPAIFIKIGSPTLLDSIANSPYQNAILTGINYRHKEAVQTMKYFFTTPLSNAQRWDYIENYFLGKIESEIEE